MHVVFSLSQFDTIAGDMKVTGNWYPAQTDLILGNLKFCLRFLIVEFIDTNGTFDRLEVPKL